MDEMPQYHFYHAGPEQYNYISTPSPQTSILSSNAYVSQQLTPHTENGDYDFPDAHISRSNSEPFLAYPQHVVSSIAPAVGPPSRMPIPPAHYREEKQKNKRTAVACESCRNKKTKCDGDTVNTCQNCRDLKLECVYRETPPSKKDNQMNEILEGTQALASEISRLHKMMSAQADQLTRYEQLFQQFQHFFQQRQCWQCGTSQFSEYAQ